MKLGNIAFKKIQQPQRRVLNTHYYRFYYARASKRLEKLKRSIGPPKKHLSKTFDECFKNGNEECKFVSGKPYDLSIPYFCGHDYRCMLLNNEWALSQAKLNVERYFPVVGVLEELNSTLELLEHKLPFFFKGVQKMYYKELLEPHKNRNKFRPKKKDATIYEYLKSHLQMEYEFYYWIRSRLFKQLTLLYGH